MSVQTTITRMASRLEDYFNKKSMEPTPTILSLHARYTLS